MLASRLTNLALYALIAALVAFALAGVLLVQPGNESTQRLGLLFGVIGTALAAVVSMIRADQTAQQTNGALDARIHAAVQRANAGLPAPTKAETAELVAEVTAENHQH